MDRRKFITGATVAGAAVSAPALSSDDASSVDARHDAGISIVGSWFATVTAVDPPLGQITDLISFHDGGVVTESRRYSLPVTPFGPLLETTGHGAWKSTGRRTFEAFFRFLLQHAETAAPVGTDNVRLRITLDRSGRRLTGKFRSEVKDLNDVVVFTTTGDYAATPITV